MALSIKSEPDATDLEHVVGALLAMPSTPTMHAASANNVQWDDEDIDIFTMLLNERPEGGDGSTPRLGPHGSFSLPPRSLTPQLQFTPGGGDAQDLNTAFTWADALSSESLMASSFFLDSNASSSGGASSSMNNNNNNNMLEMPRTPTIPSLSQQYQPPPPTTVASSSSSSTSRNGSRSGSPVPPLINLAAVALQPASSSSSSSSTKHQQPTVKRSSGGAGVATRSPPPPPISSKQHQQQQQQQQQAMMSSGKSKRKSLSLDTTRSSDGEDSDSGNDGAKLSPRARAIREKNREAVRKCRQKKKEREEALNERIRLLESENEEIRVQLRLGSEDRAREVEAETNRRAKRLEDLLAQSDADPNSSDINEQLREACASYLKHSQERAEDRSAALSGALSRVSRLINPTLFAKFYLWHGTAKDDYFTNPYGLWASISAEMDMTEDQTARLSQRREFLERLRAQIMDVSAKLSELQTNVSLKEKVDVDGVFFNSIQSLMSPRQLAKFILWIRKDPAVHEVTKGTEQLSVFLKQVSEPPAPDDFAHRSKALDDAMEAATAQGKKSRLELARERIILLTKGLWDAPKENLELIAHKGLTPDVTLIDPNNGGEYHGISKTLQYVHRIRLAFGEKIQVDLREMTMNNDKARATWVLQGTYRGRLGAPANSSEQKHLKHVSFVIVCTYTFQPNSTLIQEMLVAWDAIGLMRQIGLLKNGMGGKAPSMSNASSSELASSVGTEASSSGSMAPPPPPKRSRVSAMRFEEIQQLRRKRMDGLAQMFASSSLEEMTLCAKDILHSGCVFQDSYMGFEFRGLEACAKYAQKVRSPFPTLSVTGVKVSENEGAALGSPIRLDWSIRAKYAGPLVAAETDCSFNAVLFVTFDDVDHTIDSVHFSWNAQRLMDQLGIQRRT